MLDFCWVAGYNNTRRPGHEANERHGNDSKYADVAELADALDSGSSSLKRVWVQIPSSAPNPEHVSVRDFSLPLFARLKRGIGYLLPGTLYSCGGLLPIQDLLYYN